MFKKISLLLLACAITFGLSGVHDVRAATSPSLGSAGTFGILSSTFTRNIGVTAITGDLGYTTLGGSGSHTISAGTDYGSGAPYSTAGTDQGVALSALASQPCTFTFAPGAINLSTDTTHGPVGIYTPGVYCTGAASAASIGTAGITLSGSGTYIFRITGALTSVANSVVTLANGASSCDVFWTPTAATTLGANSTFVGTIIDDSGITIGSTSLLTGRALAFGGTVTTDTDTINSTCSVAAVTPVLGATSHTGTINVVKRVINDNGRTKTIADFPLFIANIQVPSDRTPVVSGVTNSLYAPATYFVTETTDPNYTRTFSGDCDSEGRVSLPSASSKFCIITNDDIGAPLAVPPVPPIIDVVKTASPLSLPAGPGPVMYTYTLRNIGTVPVTDITMVGDTCSPITLVSGDANTDGKLQVNETWVYRCSTTLSETHTNTVVATGWANGLTATDIASATVVVGVPVVPPLIHVTKVPNPLVLNTAGGMVTYTIQATNPGAVTLTNVNIADDKCSPLVYVSGDTNANSQLEINETWTFTCKTNLAQTTTNTVSASGEANGLTARDFAIATVVVAAPKLPATGSAPVGTNALWSIVALFSISVASILFFITRRKQTT